MLLLQFTLFSLHNLRLTDTETFLDSLRKQFPLILSTLFLFTPRHSIFLAIVIHFEKMNAGLSLLGLLYEDDSVAWPFFLIPLTQMIYFDSSHSRMNAFLFDESSSSSSSGMLKILPRRAAQSIWVTIYFLNLLDAFRRGDECKIFSLIPLYCR